MREFMIDGEPDRLEALAPNCVRPRRARPHA
jgi:hypothetical protein